MAPWRRVPAGVLGVLFCLLGMACGGTSRAGAPHGYAQSLDSATNACRRNPLACARGPGEEPLLPLLPPAAASRLEATGGWPDAVLVARIERILTECSQHAEASINEMVLGRAPTVEDCQKVLGRDAQGQQDTLARKLGRQKHTVARLCVQASLEEEHNADLRRYVLLEPVYRVGGGPGGPQELIAPAQAERWRVEAPGKLRGTLVPDVVVHASGQPLRLHAVYDFKFPCPGDREAQWGFYPRNSPYKGMSQGRAYREYLAGREEPALVHPVDGIFRGAPL